MKRFYLVVNLLLGVTAGLLLLGHFSFKPSPPDKALKRTPLPLNSNGKKVAPELTLHIPAASEIQAKNVFDPSRGKVQNEGDKTTPQNQPPLELIGICCMGEVSGAIIVDKGARTGSGNGKNDRKNIKKRYFKLGEEVQNGYCLSTIDVDKVILKRGHSIMELKIGRERFSAQAASNNRPVANAPVTVNSQQVAGAPAAPPPMPANVPHGVSDLNRPPPPQNVAKR